MFMEGKSVSRDRHYVWKVSVCIKRDAVNAWVRNRMRTSQTVNPDAYSGVEWDARAIFRLLGPHCGAVDVLADNPY